MPARPLAWLMAAFILYGSLYPFVLRPLPDGTPLSPVLLLAWHMPIGGRVLTPEVLLKLLLYGGLVWLALRVGVR